MRLTALLGCAVLLVGCAKADAPPADTLAATEAPPVMEAPAAPLSLTSLAGKWDVKVMGASSDSVLTTYVLNTTDTSAWTFAFPKRESIPMRITSVAGDSIVTDAGPFVSSVRKGGVKVRTTATMRLIDGKIVGTTTARYATTGPDSVAMLRMEGTKQ